MRNIFIIATAVAVALVSCGIFDGWSNTPPSDGSGGTPAVCTATPQATATHAATPPVLFPGVKQATSYVAVCYYRFQPAPLCDCKPQEDRVYTCAPLLSPGLGPDLSYSEALFKTVIAGQGGTTQFVQCYPVTATIPGAFTYWMPCTSTPVGDVPPPNLPPASGIKGLRVPAPHPLNLDGGVSDAGQDAGGDAGQDAGGDADDAGSTYDGGLPTDMAMYVDPLPTWSCGNSYDAACQTCPSMSMPTGTCLVDGADCMSGDQCCGGICSEDDVCESCKGDNEGCVDDSECCTDVCSLNACGG